MSESQGEARPNWELKSQDAGGIRYEEAANNPLVSLIGQESWYKRPHEELVKGFKDFIQQKEQVFQDIRSPVERKYWPPSEIIRKKLDWESGSINQERGEFFSTLRYAWDALAYDSYEPGSLAEQLAGSTLSMYYQATHETTIKLSPPQARIIDALAEAVGIPYQKGQAEIEITEKHRNHTKWILSKEYQERVAKAKSVRNK
jgi:hypothetical protein